MEMLLCYQLDFITPGSSPRRAMFRKQMRQMPNLRKKALGRPQRGQRLYDRTLNFGFLFALAISDFLATVTSSVLLVFEGHTHHFQQGLTLFIGFGCGDYGNVQPLDLVNLVVLDLRENNVLFDTQGKVSSAIERFVRQTPEVTNSR